VEILIFWARIPTPVAIEVKFCAAKGTHVAVGPAKFDVNRCNESPLRGENPDFWPLSKFNTGNLPLGGILPVKKINTIISTETKIKHIANHTEVGMVGISVHFSSDIK